jgi:POT family proton-dependent oligopeptide transporter
VLAIVISLFCWRILADISTPLKSITGRAFYLRMAVGLAVLVGLVPVIRVLLTHTELTSSSVIVFGLLVLASLVVLTVRHPQRAEQKRMIAYLVLALGSLVFWSLYQLAPMGLMLFSEHNINLDVMGIRVAPQWIQNINTIVIVIGGPLMAWWFNRLRKHGRRIDIPLQFAASLFCMGLGMLVLPIGISLAGGDGLVGFKWIALSYLLQSIGELLISPIGYAMIGKLAPTRYQGVMMGCWMMVTGVASVLAGYISGMMPENAGSTPVATNPGFSHVFSQLGWGSVATGVVLLVLIPFLRKLINHVDADALGADAALAATEAD